MPNSGLRPESSSGHDVDRKTPPEGTDKPLPVTGSFHPHQHETARRPFPTLLSEAESQAAEFADCAGTRIGAYELLEVLGQGGMGIVYKARHGVLGRIIALKTIRHDVTPHPSQTQRFLREVQAAAQLTHPNIVPIGEFGEHQGRPYYTMPFVTGGSLAQHRSRFSGNELAAAGLIEKVARGVECAHERGILHRDLKPANILLDEHGEPLVSDFGLAKLSDAGVELTQTGVVLGTPAYMAPEQAAGKAQGSGPPTDVWALGVMLYELIASKRPFTGEDTEQVKRQILQAEPPSLRGMKPGVNRRLEAIVRKCLEKDPARRYASAGVLATDLKSWSVGGPILPRPESRLRQAWRMVRGRPKLSLAVAFLGVFLAGAFAVLWWTDPERPRKETERKLSRGEPVVLIGETGMPKLLYWLDRKGTVDGQAERGDGPFSFHNTGNCFLKLMPDPQLARYRFSAEVWHRNRGSPSPSRVGLFFHYEQSGTDHFFCSLDFNDFTPKGKPCQAKFGLSIRRVASADNVFPDGIAGINFDSAEGAKVWRRLRVEVSPDQTEAFWDGRSIASISRAQLLKRFDDLKAGFKDLQMVQPSLVQGALGVYVSDGEAAFRNVIVEPLEPGKQASLH